MSRQPDFEADGIQLYCGDCLDLLPIQADALITDQPYGTGWLRGGGKNAGDFKPKSETAQWDVFDLSWISKAPTVFAAFCPPLKVWEMCLQMKTPHILKYRKSNPAPFGFDCEAIVASVAPISYDWEKEFYNGDNPLHPCQKSVDLMAWIVTNFTSWGHTVIDPYMGSGSTIVACIKTGRKAIGIERDPAHFATAVERIKRELAQPFLIAP